MAKARHRNPVWLWAFVIFVRCPVLLPLWVVMRLGQLAEGASDWLHGHLPGLR